MASIIRRGTGRPYTYEGGWRAQQWPIDIDKDHPHLHNCVAAYVPGGDYGSNSLQNLMGDDRASFTATPVWEPGREISTNNTDSGINIPTKYIPSSFPFAFRFIAKHESGVTGCYFNLAQSSVSNTFFGVSYHSSNTASCFYDVSGTYNSAPGTTTLLNNTYYDLLGVVGFNGKTSIYVNGVFEGSDDSSTIGISGSTFNTIHMGLLERATDDFFASKSIQLMQIFHGDPSEYALEMYLRPYDFLRPRSGRLFTPAPPPGGYWGINHYLKHIAGM